jgi:alkyl sulfatase BDS1-like metallo-beta-lactamase superfamily hydrolase
MGCGEITGGQRDVVETHGQRIPSEFVNLLEVADRLWRGEIDIADHHPFRIGAEAAEVGDGTLFVSSFGNVSALATDDGLLLVDTGSQALAQSVFGAVREWSRARVDTAVYSHGHIDHVFGVGLYEEEAVTNGWAPPRVVAHEALPHRFDRYVLTAGYNEVVNQRQFRLPGLRWPRQYRYPDVTYRDTHAVELGGERFELHHARGETDDHTWTWVPGRRVLCSGDMFIWSSPNAGNPQKVQRYPREWAAALREMVALEPEVLLPGHGFPVIGADRVREALTDTAVLLESLHDQTVALMNEGARLNDILHTVRGPAELLAKPYLRPIYDEPEFVVRNVWRLYGGWYDGNPANLKPARDTAFALEVASLVGGASRLASRATELAAGGDDDSLRLAAHLAELAALAAPDDTAVHAARAEVYERRVAAETSLMSRGIFSWAAHESRERSET